MSSNPPRLNTDRDRRIDAIRLNYLILDGTLEDHDGRTPFSTDLVRRLHATIGELLKMLDDRDA